MISSTKQINQLKICKFYKIDTPNLYLRVHPKSKTFVYKYKKNNSIIWITLGKFINDMSLTQAIEIATLIKSKIKQKITIDKIKQIVKNSENYEKLKAHFINIVEVNNLPLQHDLKIPTFISIHCQWHHWKKQQWKNRTHLYQSKRDVEKYIYPYFGNKPINEISAIEISFAINQVLSRVYVTGIKLIGKINMIFDFALNKGFIKFNPTPKISSYLYLKKNNYVKETQGFFKINKMPELFRLLEPINTTQSLATIILLMTVKTVEEVCGMRWSELDLVNRVWVIPPERTKNKKLHKCPLSRVSFEIINVLKNYKFNDYVFNSSNKNISTNAPRDLIRSIINKKEEEFKAVESTKYPTAQGIRHSFKNWCNNRYVPQEYSNYQLGHYNSKIANIYNGYDFFEERKNLCNAWDNFISNKSIEDYLRGNDLIENIIENNINFDNLISKKTD